MIKCAFYNEFSFSAVLKGHVRNDNTKLIIKQLKSFFL